MAANSNKFLMSTYLGIGIYVKILKEPPVFRWDRGMQTLDFVYGGMRTILHFDGLTLKLTYGT